MIGFASTVGTRWHEPMNPTTRYCAACGTANEIDASFCDHCGAALKKRAGALTQPVASSPPVSRSDVPGVSTFSVHGPRRMLWAGMAALVLVMAAVTGWALLANGAPSSKDQDRLAREWLARNKEDLMQAACIRNFPYATNPVNVDPWNTNTRVWLEALVTGGVYESRGTNTAGSLVFAHGPNAQRHIRNGRLCLADGVEVSDVTLQPQDGGDDRLARLSVGFGWTGVPEFAKGGRVAQELGNKLSPRSEMLVLIRKEGDWAEAAPADLLALTGKSRVAAAASSTTTATGFDIGRWLSGLFAFGGGPAQTAEAFYQALEQGKIKDALALIHPAQRSPEVDEKMQLMMTTARMKAATDSSAFPTNAVVVQEDETSAVVRMEIDRADGRMKTEQRIRLLKHDGRWYVSLQ